MKSVCILAALVFCWGLLASPARAQPGQVSPQKIAIIRSEAFSDEKSGINRFVSALKQLQVEFKSQQDGLIALETKLSAIAKDIQTLSAVPVIDPKVINAKNEEGEKTQLDYNRKKDDYNAAFEKRFSAVVVPVQSDIGSALADYGRQKSFQLIFDLSKDDKGFLIWSDIKTTDITDDFIRFYNSRPAAAVPASK